MSEDLALRVARVEHLVAILPATQWLDREDDARAIKDAMGERVEVTGHNVVVDEQCSPGPDLYALAIETITAQRERIAEIEQALDAIASGEHHVEYGFYAVCFFCKRTVDGASSYHAKDCAWVRARAVLAKTAAPIEPPAPDEAPPLPPPGPSCERCHARVGPLEAHAIAGRRGVYCERCYANLTAWMR